MARHRSVAPTKPPSTGSVRTSVNSGKSSWTVAEAHRKSSGHVGRPATGPDPRGQIPQYLVGIDRWFERMGIWPTGLHGRCVSRCGGLLFWHGGHRERRHTTSPGRRRAGEVGRARLRHDRRRRHRVQAGATGPTRPIFTRGEAQRLIAPGAGGLRNSAPACGRIRTVHRSGNPPDAVLPSPPKT